MANRTSEKTRTRSETAPQRTAAIAAYKADLWQMADTLRGSMDAAEYKHVVLGLIFLKYIFDAFEVAHVRRAHPNRNGNGGRARSAISFYSQESNYTAWRLAKMNLAICGIEGQIAHGDTFYNDRYPNLKNDYVLANPPHANFAWVLRCS